MKRSTTSGLCGRGKCLDKRRSNPGRTWRGNLSIPPHTPPLVRKLFEIANRDKTLLCEIAERAGLKRGTIKDWRHKSNPSVPNLQAAFNALGYELVVRPIREDVGVLPSLTQNGCDAPTEHVEVSA